MDAKELQAGLTAIAAHAEPPTGAIETIRRQAVRRRRVRRAVAVSVGAGVASVVATAGVGLGLFRAPDPSPPTVVPAQAPSPSQPLPTSPIQRPPSPVPGEIVCVYEDGAFAGAIDLDRPSDAPPLTKPEKDASCAAEWPGSRSA